MILYPILKWYFDLVLALPSIIWGIVIIGALALGFFGFSELRTFIFWIFGGPLVLFLVCDLCKGAQSIPLLGIFAVGLRLVIDAVFIGGIVKIIKFFLVGKK